MAKPLNLVSPVSGLTTEEKFLSDSAHRGRQLLLVPFHGASNGLDLRWDRHNGV